MLKKSLHFYFHKYIKKDKFFELNDFFNTTQYWKRDQILEYQWNKFKETLNYAYEKVPYYKNLYDNAGLIPNEIKNRSDLLKLPILTKEDIRKNYNSLKAKGIKDKRIVNNSTSGSTGVNINFLSDREAIERTALQNRCYNWMGVDLFDKKLSIWGSGWDIAKSKKIASRIKSYIKNSVVLSGYNLSEKDIEEYYKIMLRFNPKLLVSYPSIFYTLAETFQKNGWKFSPFAMQIGGEKLFPFQREFVEKVFNSKIYDFYGARDAGMIAQECSLHNGLHIIAENVLVEVLDENNNPIEEGEGDLVITDLNNKVMPFIRYRIGDRAYITQRECKCGRGLPLLKEVIGRSFEIIKFPNGNKVGGSFWTLVLRSEPGIKNFQVVQKTQDWIKINYIPDSNFNSKSIDKFIERIHQYSGDKLKITFEQVDEIPVTKAGKFKFVISELNDSRKN